MQASPVQAASVEVFAAVPVAWGDVDCEVDSEEAFVVGAVVGAEAGAVSGMRVLAATFLTRIFMPIILALISRLPLPLG